MVDWEACVFVAKVIGFVVIMGALKFLFWPKDDGVG